MIQSSCMSWYVWLDPHIKVNNNQAGWKGMMIHIIVLLSTNRKDLSGGQNMHIIYTASKFVCTFYDKISNFKCCCSYCYMCFRGYDSITTMYYIIIAECSTKICAQYISISIYICRSGL